MSQRNPFDRQHIEESAVAQEPGLLEQFNLPPDVIAFLRKNQRTIWIVIGAIAIVIVAAALYGQYNDYREDKAATALALAIQQEGEQKSEALTQVVDQYGSTSSGMWARIELAHLAAGRGDIAEALKEFNDVRSEISADDPLMPLILYALGVYFEKNNELGKAVEAFQQLGTFSGFESSSYEAMGRIYEQQGEKAKALDMYKKSLEPSAEGTAASATISGNEIIQAKINSLQD